MPVIASIAIETIQRAVNAMVNRGTFKNCGIAAANLSISIFMDTTFGGDFNDISDFSLPSAGIPRI